jgi:hypothetical protein
MDFFAIAICIFLACAILLCGIAAKQFGILGVAPDPLGYWIQPLRWSLLIGGLSLLLIALITWKFVR